MWLLHHWRLGKLQLESSVEINWYWAPSPAPKLDVRTEFMPENQQNQVNLQIFKLLPHGTRVCVCVCGSEQCTPQECTVGVGLRTWSGIPVWDSCILHRSAWWTSTVVTGEEGRPEPREVVAVFSCFPSDLLHSWCCLILWEMQVVSNDKTPLLNIVSLLSSTSLAILILCSHPDALIMAWKDWRWPEKRAFKIQCWCATKYTRMHIRWLCFTSVLTLEMQQFWNIFRASNYSFIWTKEKKRFSGKCEESLKNVKNY